MTTDQRKLKVLASRPWWLFAGADFYPSGGIRDFISAHLDRASAVEAATKLPTLLTPENSGWAQVVNIETGTIHFLVRKKGLWKVEFFRGPKRVLHSLDVYAWPDEATASPPKTER